MEKKTVRPELSAERTAARLKYVRSAYYRYFRFVVLSLYIVCRFPLTHFSKLDFSTKNYYFYFWCQTVKHSDREFYLFLFSHYFDLLRIQLRICIHNNSVDGKIDFLRRAHEAVFPIFKYVFTNIAGQNMSCTRNLRAQISMHRKNESKTKMLQEFQIHRRLQTALSAGCLFCAM